MGEQAKGEQPSAGQRTKGGETRFTTSGLAGTPRLMLENFNGDIRISGAEQDYIAVKVFHDDDIVDLEQTAQVSYSESGELAIKSQPMGQINRQVRVLRDAWKPNKNNFFEFIGDFAEQVSKLGHGWGAADYEVTVPLHCDLSVGNTTGEINVQNVTGSLSIKTVSGEIEATRLSGNVTLSSASGEVEGHYLSGTVYLRSISGDIEAHNLDGNVVIQTASGDVEAHHLSGKLGFKSISGELEVSDANLNGFYLSTTSGDMELNGNLQPGEYEIRTVSGDTKLHVQPGFSAKMTGRTVSGDFHSNLPYIRSDEEWRGAAVSSGAQEQEKTDEQGGYKYEYRQPGYKYEYQWDANTGRGHGHGHSDERRRHRNRWEFLIGDPATAEQGDTRLRVRTTSGDLKLEPGGQSSYQGKASDADYQKTDEADYTRPLRYSDTGDIGRMVEGEDFEPDQDDEQSADTRRMKRDHERLTRDEVRMRHDQQRQARDEIRMRHDQEREAAANVMRMSHHRERQAATDAMGTRSDKERTRVDILQAVESKEISVEEAMRLLRQMD